MAVISFFPLQIVLHLKKNLYGSPADDKHPSTNMFCVHLKRRKGGRLTRHEEVKWDFKCSDVWRCLSPSGVTRTCRGPRRLPEQILGSRRINTARSRQREHILTPSKGDALSLSHKLSRIFYIFFILAFSSWETESAGDFFSHFQNSSFSKARRRTPQKRRGS